MKTQSFVLAATLCLTEACSSSHTAERRVVYSGHNYPTDCDQRYCSQVLQDCRQVQQESRASLRRCTPEELQREENDRQSFIAAKRELTCILEMRDKMLTRALTSATLNGDRTTANIFRALRSHYAVIVGNQLHVVRILSEQMERHAAISHNCQELRAWWQDSIATCNRNMGYCAAEQQVCRQPR
jgi:hypothetical protein